MLEIHPTSFRPINTNLMELAFFFSIHYLNPMDKCNFDRQYTNKNRRNSVYQK